LVDGVERDAEVSQEPIRGNNDLLLWVDWSSSAFFTFLILVSDWLLLVEFCNVVNIPSFDSLILLESTSVSSSLSF